MTPKPTQAHKCGRLLAQTNPDQLEAQASYMASKRDSLTPGTLIDGPRMCAAAADAVNDKLPNAVHVLSHVLGMSIELTLKAYLLHRGLNTADLKRLGHKLDELFDAAVELGLTSTGSRSFRIRVLGRNFQQRIFGYPQEGVITIIVPARLREIAHELITEVFPLIKGSEVLLNLQGEPGLAIRSVYPDDVFPSGWASNSTKDVNT